MTEMKDNMLPKTDIFHFEILSAVLSPIGTDLAKIVKQRGKELATHIPHIEYLPDGPEISFDPTFELSIGYNYSVLFDPVHHVVVINQNNPHRPSKLQKSLALPSRGEIQSSHELTCFLVDYSTKPPKILNPIENQTSPNEIKNFYVNARNMVMEVQKLIEML